MAKILPVASGKGGVGKSFFVANLSVILGELDQKVIAVDLDLGGSNLHTMLGIKNDLLGIGNFIYDKEIDFSTIIHETDYKNVTFIPGDSLHVGTANLQYFKKMKIIKELIKLEADWVILDLGSGSAVNVLDFFTISNCGILMTSPDITAVLNLYQFLKNAYYRYILRSFKRKDPLRVRLTEAAKMRLEKEDLRFYEYLRLLKRDFPEQSEKLDELTSNFFPKLLLNMGDNERDIHFGENLRHIIHTNLGLDVEYLGLLPTEPLISQCIIARKPLYDFERDTKWVENCSRVARRLIDFNDYPVTIYEEDIDSIDIVYDDMQNLQDQLLQ